LVALLLLGNVTALVRTWPPLRRQVLMSVSQQPTPFTELYFSDPATLVSGLVGRAPQSIGYTVVNHTGAYRNYEVTVSLVSAGTTRVLARSSLGLAEGATARRSVIVGPGVPGTAAMLEVSIGSGEEIHLLLRFA